MKRFWVRLDESEREKWDFIPLTAVGPVRFGMTYDEVAGALGGIRPVPYLWGGPVQFDEPTVTTYYNESGTLSCVAVDSLHGPQVTMDGLRLTGRVPSELRQQFEDYVASHGMGLVISQQADPGSEEIGLVLRAQRTEDALFTRPVFVAREWAYRCCDASEGPVPQEEWRQR